MFDLIAACCGRNQKDVDVESGRALVTGGAQGIGRAICEALLKRGCKVCCVDVNSVKGQSTVEELKNAYGESNCIFVECDVSSSENFEEAYLKAKQSFGNLNILINNAGVLDVDKAVDVNLKGVIHGCDIALKYMGKNNGGDGGVVVSVGSVAGLQPIPVQAFRVYSATKAGVIMLTRCHGLDYEKSGIKFTCVCPSAVNTGMFVIGVSNKEGKEMAERTPLMEPSELAEAIIRLIEVGKSGAVMTVIKGEKNEYVKFPGKNYLK